MIVQEHGRNAYLLTKLEETPPPSIVGCMRERTDCAAGEVVNASEPWDPGPLA